MAVWIIAAGGLADKSALENYNKTLALPLSLARRSLVSDTVWLPEGEVHAWGFPDTPKGGNRSKIEEIKIGDICFFCTTDASGRRKDWKNAYNWVATVCGKVDPQNFANVSLAFWDSEHFLPYLLDKPIAISLSFDEFSRRINPAGRFYNGSPQSSTRLTDPIKLAYVVSHYGSVDNWARSFMKEQLERAQGSCRSIDQPEVDIGVQEKESLPLSPFSIGHEYSRSNIFKLLKIYPEPDGGKWFTGYVEHEGNHFIFANIGNVGRTGHDYNNYFEGDQLVWFGKGGSELGHSSIEKLLSPASVTHVFYRMADRDPFIFAGVATPLAVFDTTPVKVVWRFSDQHSGADDEDPRSNMISEGAVQKKMVRVYERNRGARLKCISRWGWKCFVCQFDFGSFYGKLGEGFIHVHHLKPLSEIGAEYLLDPELDLRPVCPNCHSMLHRLVPALTIQELKDLIKPAG